MPFFYFCWGEIMTYDYIGWVPCVSGRLFFEYTFPGLGAPKYSINHVEQNNESTSYQRYIIVSSVVDWKDGKEKDSSGKYNVFFIGHKSSDEINLHGSVYIFPEDLNSPSLNIIETLLSAIYKKIIQEDEIKDEYNQLNKILDEINEKRFYKVKVKVESPGFTKLKYVSATDDNLTESHKYTIVRQAYYYIKYAFHRHRHHHDKAESLTTIHSLAVEEERVGIKLLNDLRKSLVQLKRDFEPYNCNNIYHSSGISSYAKSLAESCYKDGYLKEEEYKSEISYFDNVRSSLEIMAGVVEKDIAKRTMNSGNARAIILFVLSIIMPVVLIFRKEIVDKSDGANNFIIDIIAVVVSSDYNLLLTAFILVSFYGVYMAMKMNHGGFWLCFKYYRDIMEQIVYERAKANIMLSLILIMSVSLIINSIYFMFIN